MYRLFRNLSSSVFVALCCIYAFGLLMGCGDSAEEEVDDLTNDNAPSNITLMGLQGDTYRNQEYLFKVSQLPVDAWAVEEVTNIASYDQQQAWKADLKAASDPEAIIKFNDTDVLLLMEPTSDDNFQETLTKALEQELPFIFLEVIEQSETDHITPKQFVEAHLTDLETAYTAEAFEIMEQGERMSRDRYPGYFYELTWVVDESSEEPVQHWGRTMEAYFMRRDSEKYVYHFKYWAPEDQYEQYLPVFEEVLSYLEFTIS